MFSAKKIKITFLTNTFLLAFSLLFGLEKKIEPIKYRDLVILIDEKQEYIMLRDKLMLHLGTPITESLALAIHQKCSPILFTTSLWRSFKLLKDGKLFSLLKDDEWELFIVDQNFFLLMPKKYKNEILKIEGNIKKEYGNLNLNLGSDELALGIKIRSFDKWEMNFNKLPNLPFGKKYSINKILNKFFVTKKDLAQKDKKLENKIISKYLYPWNIVLMGHGLASKLEVKGKDNFVELLQKLYDAEEKLGFIPSNQLLKKNKEITFFEILKRDLFQKIIDFTEENDLLSKNKLRDEIRALSKQDKYSFLKNKSIEELKKDIQNCLRLRELKNLEAVWITKNNLKNYLKELGGKIAGLPVLKFREMCDFFDKNINVNFFFYITCYGGGYHFLIPYITTGIKKVFNYSMASGAFLDKPVLSPAIEIKDKDYKGDEKVVGDVTIDKEELKLVSNRDFKGFFDSL